MLFGGHEKRTVNPFVLWDEVLWARDRKNDSRAGITRSSNFYMDMSAFYSDTDNITFAYTIDGYPSEIEVSYRSVLRRECRAGVRMSFISTLDKHKIDWDSNQMAAKLKTWKILEATTDDVDEYNLHSNLAVLDNQAWRRWSLRYLNKAELRRKRKTFVFRSVLLVSGKRGENFDTTIREMLAVCKDMGLKVTRITDNIQDYTKTFSPFSLVYNDKIYKQVGSSVLTDENIARFNSYSQGRVGKAGVYWGTDVYSHFPCLKVVKHTSESAENWLITAETGGGKSFFIKVLLLQLLAVPYYRGTIMDVEGFEYVPIADYLEIGFGNRIVIVNMAEGTGSYFDPVEIVLTGDAELDKDMYSLSVAFTLSTFKTLLGAVSITDEWVDIVVNDAVAQTYAKAGVTNDMSTWKNSKGLTLFDVYETLKELMDTYDIKRAISATEKQDEYNEKLNYSKVLDKDRVRELLKDNNGFKNAVQLAIAKTSRYFEDGGTRRAMFTNRVSIWDIVDAKLVICSFGMAGKSASVVDPIQMALMQLCAANISHLRSIFSKHAGAYNFKLWEEFQRWGGFPDSEKTIATALTGGRKLGDVNIIITNVVKELLETDRFKIFSNITSIAVGAIKDEDVRRGLCERLSIPQMIPELDKLAKNNVDMSSYSDGDSIKRNKFSKAFLVGLDMTMYTISKMSLPSQLESSMMFRTGISLDTNYAEVEK